MNTSLSMQITPQQEQRQEQRLVMTPKMQQSIKILLMSRMELVQHVEQEMEENPLLEQVTPETETDEEIEEPEDNTEEDEEIEELDISWDDLYDDSSSYRAPNEPEHRDDEDELYYYNFAVETITLQDHLMMQLGIAPFSEEEYGIGEEIIGNINDDGFLIVEPEEIAEELDCEISKINKVLNYIQHEFEPTGIGTRDTRECLLRQIESMHLDDILAKKIIEKHYEDFINNRLPTIARDFKVDISEIQKEIELIKTLNPIPGNRFNTGEPNRNVIPDVEVKKVNGKYKVIDKNDNVPRLMLSRQYIKMMQNSESLKSKTKEWLEERKRRAIELLKMIDQRQDTIKNTTKAIFEVQEEFLEKGIEGLKPLTLKDIADITGVHESTVSRVTTNKYVQTPQGVYELKFFFTGGLERDSGDNISTRKVKQMLRKIIDNEEPANPLSDSKISDKFKEKGIHIERRTITKYRNEMNILSSTKRRSKWK